MAAKGHNNNQGRRGAIWPFSRHRKNVSSLFASMATICVIWLVHTLGIGFFSGTTQVSTLSLLPSSALASPRLPPTEFSLGMEQSGGFFTDITNENWKLLQKYHAELFPNYYIETSFTNEEENLNKYSHPINPGWGEQRISLIRNSNLWYGRNFQVEFICPMARRLPSDSISDGAKWVCNPNRISQQTDCLVYSVGSNGKAEFEKAVKEVIGNHCEIHTFDPVKYNKRNGDFKEALQPYATFHNWGLGTEDQARENSMYKTVKKTMAELGHTGKTIDIFKIDCEWCEWSTWQEWLTVDMKQILVETHNAPMPNARDFFFNLHDHGFVIFSKEANYDNGAGGVEYAFIKLSTDFFLNSTTYKNKAGKENLVGEFAV